MGSVEIIYFVLTSVLLNSVQSVSNKTCHVNETECLTKAANKIYQAVTSGIKDLTDPLDPYYAEKVSGDFGAIHYVQTNVTLTGAKNCVIEVLRVVSKEPLAYEYILRCPKLLLDFQYEVENFVIDAKAHAAESMEVMLIKIKGRGEYIISEKDQKTRLILMEYKKEVDLRGKFTFVHKKYIKGNKYIFKFGEIFINNNGKTIVNSGQNPILESFLDVFTKSLNKYLAVIPIAVLFAKDQ